jgi:hypothetical protein
MNPNDTMKQQLQIRLSGQLLLAFFSLLFHSCSNEIDCSCIITQEEEKLVSIYNVGDIAVFKNDTTGVTDIMHVASKGSNRSSCSSPCVNGKADVVVSFKFSHLRECRVGVWHRATPNITFSNSCSSCLFELNETLQSITVNNTLYDDVYISSIDPAQIEAGNEKEIPWKIAYSKSRGFVRFYMKNGETWSRQQ